jgi:hypothetical protein
VSARKHFLRQVSVVITASQPKNKARRERAHEAGLSDEEIYLRKSRDCRET